MRVERFIRASLFSWLVSAASSFSARGPSLRKVGLQGRGDVALKLTPEEERAALLSDYLTRAHEEKLKAVKAIEEKKDAEIAILKEYLKDIRSQNEPQASNIDVPEVSADVDSLSKAELVDLVKSYQLFVTQYLDEPHLPEVVKEVEAPVEQKKEEASLKEAPKPAATSAVPAPAPVAKDAPPVPAPTPTKPPQDGSLYAKRNARLVSAAAAGKSRWGGLEVDRAVFLTKRAEARLKEQASANEAQKQVLQKEEPKVNGASAPSDQMIPEALAPDSFQLRNSRVAAASKAGKSRWGDMEVQRIQNSVGSLDAQPDQKASDASHESPVPSVFQQRNARVAASGMAGKSRWGEMEVLRVQSSVSTDVAAKAVQSEQQSASDSPESGTPVPSASVDTNFQLRNARVVAAAKAGKSRWGDMEVLRVANSM